MTSRKPNKAARWIGNVLLFAGVMAVTIWACSFFGVTIWQYWQNRQFERQQQQRTQLATPNPDSVPGSAPRRIVKEGDVLGRLKIPRLHLQAIIREGDDDGTLSLALGHIPGTAFPGQLGNIGLAGHRDRLFRGLRHIAANDKITFETPDAKYVYRVESTQVVKPQDVGVLRPGPTPELTLVTCYPFNYIGSAPERFIVKARQVVNTTNVSMAVPGLAPEPVRTKEIEPVKSNQIGFDVAQGHSRELVPGKIWFGLSSADPARRSVDGWVWVMPERRTIWLKDVDVHQPVVFYQDGGKRELVITGIARSSARGFLD